MKQLTAKEAKRVNMTPMQKVEYSLYLKGCKINGVKPVLADFLLYKMPDSVLNYMEVQQNEVEWEARALAIKAVAPRLVTTV